MINLNCCIEIMYLDTAVFLFYLKIRGNKFVEKEAIE